jgi:hypothetical protein
MLKSAVIFITLLLSGTSAAKCADIGPISILLFDMQNPAPTHREDFRSRVLHNFATLVAGKQFNYPLIRLLSENSPDAIRLTGLQPNDLVRLLELDLDGDGELDASEVQVWADDAFRRYDLLGKGSLLPQEIAAVEADLAIYRSHNPYWQKLQTSKTTSTKVINGSAPNQGAETVQSTYFELPPSLPPATPFMSQMNAKCFIPPIRPSEQLVLFSFYEGTKQTDVTLSGQEGDETFVVDVAIEEGSDPLYIVLTSHGSTLYRFTGAVERISTVVPTSTTRKSNSGEGIGGSGVVGVPKNKVAFLESWNCLTPFNETGGLDEAKARGELSLILSGRQPDFISATYAVNSVQLPSMRTSTNKVDHDQVKEHGLPVISVDPNVVVSAIPAERWEVLPGPAGIKQLVQQGYLKRLNSEGYQQEYKIVKSFPRFPAALSGGHTYKFLLGRGVKSPEGQAGWSCILSEETGLPLGKPAWSPHC